MFAISVVDVDKSMLAVDRTAVVKYIGERSKRGGKIAGHRVDGKTFVEPFKFCAEGWLAWSRIDRTDEGRVGNRNDVFQLDGRHTQCQKSRTPSQSEIVRRIGEVVRCPIRVSHRISIE